MGSVKSRVLYCTMCEDCACSKTGLRQILSWLHRTKRLLLHNSNSQKTWPCEGDLQASRNKNKSVLTSWEIGQEANIYILGTFCRVLFFIKGEFFLKAEGWRNRKNTDLLLKQHWAVGKVQALFKDRQWEQLWGAQHTNLTLIRTVHQNLSKGRCWKQDRFEWRSKI